MLAQCPECGASVRSTDRFCTDCGHALAPEEKPKQSRRAKGKDEASPATAAAEPESPAPPPEPSAPPWVITVPAWLARDWPGALRFAGAALAVGIALQYLVLLLLILAHTIAGFDVTWDNQLDRVPVHVFLGLHGSMGEIGVWVTGLAWLGLAFWVAGRMTRPEDALPGEATRLRRATLAVKVAVAYMIPVGLLIGLLEPTDYLEWLFPMGFIGEAIGRADWNVAGGVALGLLASFGAAWWVAARRGGSMLLGSLGLDASRIPRRLDAAWAGAKRTLLVAIPSVLAYFVVGELIDVLATDDLEFRVWLGLVVAVVVGTVLWMGIDAGVIFLLMSMRFFLGDDTVAAGGRPGWMWPAVAFVAAAFFLGGSHAVRRHEPTSALDALKTGLLTGALVAVALFVVTWFAINPFPGEVITGPALGLGLLWSLVSGLGGVYQASRAGLFRGIRLVAPGED